MLDNDSARWLPASFVSTALVAIAVLGPGCSSPEGSSSVSASASAIAVDPTGFMIGAYAGQIAKQGGKCLDYASEIVGNPLILNDCSSAHSLRIVELPERMGHDGCVRKHEVALTTGGLFVGVGAMLPGSDETRLELQPPSPGRLGQPLSGVTMEQRFVIDGDSIIVAADRDTDASGPNVRVAKVQNSRGKNGSLVVLGPRELRDNELWAFAAADGSGRDPTTGFVHVSGLIGLRAYFASQTPRQCARQTPSEPKWPDYDTVVVVDDGPIVLSTGPAPADASEPVPAILVTDGVTVRGDRRGARLGPLLAEDRRANPLIETLGNDIRITGLRIDGPTRDPDADGSVGNRSMGVRVVERESFQVPDRVTYSRLYVDHNDVSEWMHRGTVVDGGDELIKNCDSRPPPESMRPNRSQVARNFFHHNRVKGEGYGVDVQLGGFPLVLGNTFVSNRHAIAENNSTSFTGYRARSNLVLSDAPVQYDLIFLEVFTHDFDIHGTGENGFSGIAGGFTEVAFNTFLGKTDLNTFPPGVRANFKLRGIPCDRVEVGDNIFLQSEGNAVQLDLSELPLITDTAFVGDPHEILQVAKHPNQFNHDNPTSHLAVGDFDGDGREDVFLATGAAWYYAPGAEAEWRLLSPDKTDDVASLLFGDFDGDGRTDVVGQNGPNALVSWGGVGEWESLNFIPPWNSRGGPSIKNLAVGNFDGIDGDDLFFANGEGWYVAAGGSGSWVRSGPSSFRVKDLRFGDFNGNGTTDVFGIVSDKWQFSDGTTQNWTPLPVSLTSSVDALFVADFDGNGTDDIGSFTVTTSSVLWRFSRDAAHDWQGLTNTLKTFVAVGRFLPTPGAGAALLLWDDKKLTEVHIGSSTPTALSRQDMR